MKTHQLFKLIDPFHYKLFCAEARKRKTQHRIYYNRHYTIGGLIKDVIYIFESTPTSEYWHSVYKKYRHFTRENYLKKFTGNCYYI